jgi:hypothetical protein
MGSHNCWYHIHRVLVRVGWTLPLPTTLNSLRTCWSRHRGSRRTINSATDFPVGKILRWRVLLGVKLPINRQRRRPTPYRMRRGNALQQVIHFYVPLHYPSTNRVINQPINSSSIIRRCPRFICCCFNPPRLFAQGRWRSLPNGAPSAPDRFPPLSSSRSQAWRWPSHRAVVFSVVTRLLCGRGAPSQQCQGVSVQGEMSRLTIRGTVPTPHPELLRRQVVQAEPTARCEMPGGGQPTR